MYQNKHARQWVFSIAFFGLSLFFTGCIRKNANVVNLSNTNEIPATNQIQTNQTATNTADFTKLTQTVAQEQNSENWQTFKSKQMDYTLQYPQGWDAWTGSDFYTDLEERSTDIEYLSRLPRSEFSNITSDLLTFVIELTPKNDQTFEDIIAEKSKFSEVSNVQPLVIQGKPAVQQVENDPRDPEYEYGYSTTTYVDSGKDVYAITARASSPETYALQQKLIDALLQTFTVIEPAV